LRLIKKIVEKSNQMVNFVCGLLGKKFKLMFEDEAGFGRTNKPKRCWCTKGIRPSVPIHRVREYMQAYGAVSPLDGDMVSLVLPKSNTNCMNIFLQEVSNTYPDHYILMVMDNAAWHKSKSLVIPENIEIFPLLPYTPELNPIEMIWDELREKFFRNEIFPTLNNVVDRLCEGLLFLQNHNEIVKSITGWHWIINSVLQEN
jgi:transposase